MADLRDSKEGSVFEPWGMRKMAREDEFRVVDWKIRDEPM